MTTTATLDERTRVQLLFQDRLEQRRRQNRLVVLIPVAVFIVVVAIRLVVHSSPPWNRVEDVMALVACLIAAIPLFTLPRVRCPKCDHTVFGRIERVCPECSAETVDRGKWYQRPHCRSCGLGVRRDSGTWRVKYCTHCGVQLHKDGARV